eukprot:8193919-Pyramimonas_sp.AAC.1
MMLCCDSFCPCLRGAWRGSTLLLLLMLLGRSFDDIICLRKASYSVGFSRNEYVACGPGKKIAHER